MSEPRTATAVRQGLDPRTKIVLVIACSIAVMSPAGLRFVPAVLLLAIGLSAWELAWGRAIGVVLTAAAMVALGWLLPVWWPNPLTVIVSLACSYLLRFVAAISVGMHVISTTSPTQLSAGLRAWRIPRAIAVTLSVMLRFFPVVGAEAAAVLDAMKLRGLVGVHGIVRHPILTVERFTVPMIAASLRSSEDLAASAILRGLGSRRTPTAMHPPRFRPTDLALLLAVAVLTAATLTQPSLLT
ncbi:energy-coupling factor transporter transmembrane component T [Rothia uropygialis]|uniref:energy-coupling factor transporter transmembrane component T n=1 Tax=Kocuria sp. 36 TaxID=1415402 RepID=UPI00101DC63D|nr:energy-coupling factor transporter transmembrane component T [Kocuria sp. 36]